MLLGVDIGGSKVVVALGDASGRGDADRAEVARVLPAQRPRGLDDRLQPTRDVGQAQPAKIKALAA